jgi:Flp pilus assembly protein TadG
MRRLHKLREVFSDRRGGAVLEFAVVGPLLLTMVLGAVDVGRMFYVRQNLEYATEEAARYFMLNPTSTTSAVTSYLQGKMLGGVGSGISVSYTDTANCNGNSSVTCTMVSATYTFTFIAGYLGLGTKTLRANAQAVRISS